MKSLTPASTAAITIMASASIDGVVSADTFPFPKPEFRYKAFHVLSPTAQAVAEDTLGYTEVTWNTHRLAPIELYSWENLTPDEQNGASELGYGPDTWDCFGKYRGAPPSIHSPYSSHISLHAYS